MKVKYNPKNLRRIITDLSVVTNVTMAFYDSDQKPLFFHTPEGDFCSMIQCKEGMQTCVDILFSTAIKIDFDNYLNQIMDYIDSHLHEKLNISFLYSKFHISKDSLYDGFRDAPASLTIRK